MDATGIGRDATIFFATQGAVGSPGQATGRLGDLNTPRMARRDREPCHSSTLRCGGGARDVAITVPCETGYPSVLSGGDLKVGGENNG